MEAQVAMWQLAGDAIIIACGIIVVCLIFFVSFTIMAFVYPLIVNWFHWVKKRFAYEHGNIIEPNNMSTFMNGNFNGWTLCQILVVVALLVLIVVSITK